MELSNSQSQMSQWKKVVLLMIDPQEEEVQVEGEAPMRFLENVCCLLDILISTDRSIGDMKLPRLG